MSHPLAHASFVDHRRRQIILVGLFDALDRAGVRPVSPTLLHSLWYLSNALAPAWALEPFDAAVLKTSRQPYFPMLQRDLDALVGMGMLKVSGLVMSDGNKGLQGQFVLHREFATPVLDVMESIVEEADLLEFLSEVVQALNRLGEDDQRFGMTADATYGDPRIDVGNVVDLGEWIENGAMTKTAEVLAHIGALAGRELLPAERMDIYLDHLGRRLRRG
ncbi:MAG TPA: hypothetical protein VLC71_02260 [Thermomonas sp.]|nr:hypothetical protein [Thermomonas sp.]